MQQLSGRQLRKPPAGDPEPSADDVQRQQRQQHLDDPLEGLEAHEEAAGRVDRVAAGDASFLFDALDGGVDEQSSGCDRDEEDGQFEHNGGRMRHQDQAALFVRGLDSEQTVIELGVGLQVELVARQAEESHQRDADPVDGDEPLRPHVHDGAVAEGVDHSDELIDRKEQCGRLQAHSESHGDVHRSGAGWRRNTIGVQHVRHADQKHRGAENVVGHRHV